MTATHTVKQPVGSRIDGQSMVRQTVAAPGPTAVIPVISPIGARIGRASRPTSTTTTRATLRIPGPQYLPESDTSCRANLSRRHQPPGRLGPASWSQTTDTLSSWASAARRVKRRRVLVGPSNAVVQSSTVW